MGRSYFACCENENQDGAIWIIDFEKATNKAEQILDGKDFFSTITQANSTDLIHLATAHNSNERIEAQQARFTISSNPLMDHADFFKGHDSLEKICIPKILKTELMIRLNAMNINAKTLFPGTDGLGKSISEFYEHWDSSSVGNKN